MRDATFRIGDRSDPVAHSGAAFAVARDLIVTNRHVVEDADPLRLSTWDGDAFEVEVAVVAPDHDLAALRTNRALGSTVEPAQRPAQRGDLVHVAGYPLGGEFGTVKGIVVDEVEGPALGEPAQVLRIRAVVLPGYSGGPVLDDDGRLVGVVYALGRTTRLALAIPLLSLVRWLDDASLRWRGAGSDRPTTPGG
ncbi:MAG TPA: serine protease [Nitriliruptorales bacterium]|nr:serine protease [Nitriliruptorales bacterium]